MTIHAGPRLQRALPPQITEARRKAIAIEAAKAAVLHESRLLSCVVDLGRTYRKAEMIEQAVATFRDNLNSIESKVDFESTIRGYWYEWGVCEGLAGDTPEHRAADAWLQGLSLSDHLSPALIDGERIKLSCAGLGVSFGKLAQSDPEGLFAKALRAAAFLRRLTNPDPKTAHYSDHYDREADKLKAPHPRDVLEAIAWLAAGVAQAGRELQDPFLKALLKPDQVSFNLLQTMLNPDSTPKARRVHPSKPSAPPSVTPADNILLQLSNQHEERIQAGIKRVLNEAWKAVPSGTAPEKRFQLAIRKAEQSISRLSPHIKRRVRAHFQTKDWEPLKSSEPKP